jgi:hypothetical protein
MRGFYGKSFVPPAGFVIDKRYPNKTSMDSAINGSNDNILLGRYVLIDYNIEDSEYSNNNSNNLSVYDFNLNKDGNNNYNKTLWEKVIDINNNFKYKIVANLNGPWLDIATQSQAAVHNPNNNIWDSSSDEPAIDFKEAGFDRVTSLPPESARRSASLKFIDVSSS